MRRLLPVAAQEETGRYEEIARGVAEQFASSQKSVFLRSNGMRLNFNGMVASQ
jgi:hypothetical protein